MSHSSDQGEQGRAESHGRWAECEPGPSRCEQTRQGYCACCRILYADLEQHLSSLRHLDSVRTTSRGCDPVAGGSKVTLLERFLQDVLLHHPHRYGDSRPTHADLPSVSPPLPRPEPRFSDDQRGTVEEASSSDDALCRPMGRREDGGHGQSEERVRKETLWDRLSAPMAEQVDIGSVPAGCALSQAPPPTRTTPPQHRAPPSVHRKAHRKTNRRKSSSGSSAHSGGPGPPSRPHAGLGSTTRTKTPKEPGPWQSWQRERRAGFKHTSFTEHMDALDETIQEVIQMCCHGTTSSSHQQEETDSVHFSLSQEAESEEWEPPVQVLLQEIQAQGRDLGGLMEVQVQLEDQDYSQQLDSALHSKVREEGFWTLPIEEVLPVPAYIPQFFRGKSWAQIQQEDEEKVERLVGQFRRGRFICYFDTESLARYGRRSHKIKGKSQTKEAEPDSVVLPLLDMEDGDLSYERRRRRRRRRSFRVASRCQVVKVSHSTQTLRLYVPAVSRQLRDQTPGPAQVTAISCQSPDQGAGPTHIPADGAAITPEVQPWSGLPASYSNIITPVQPRTSLVYLLCSPSGSAPTCTPSPSPAHKRCRKKRRPLDQQGVKVKYKRLPLTFYDPSTNRIMKNPPKGFLRCRGPAPSGAPPPCVRQLFRSLSPELNTDRAPAEGSAGSSRVRSHASADDPFLLSPVSGGGVRRAGVGRTPSKTPPLRKRTEQGRGGRRERTQTSKRKTRAQATPPLTRREGLRRTGLSPAPLTRPLPRSPPARRGRARGRRSRESRRR